MIEFIDRHYPLQLLVAGGWALGMITVGIVGAPLVWALTLVVSMKKRKPWDRW